MSHGTENLGNVNLTNEEIETLYSLLKHPKVKKMAEEVRNNDKPDEE